MLAEQQCIPEEDINPPPGTATMISGVSTSAAVSTDELWDNIIKNSVHNFPIFEDMTEYGKLKNNKPIAIVGGGPSLKTQLEQLRNFRTIIACGSVHDYLIDNDIIPTYAANCDPDSVVAKYYSKPDPEIKYLMASNTSQKVIEALEGQQIISWHCHSPDLQDKVSALEKAKYNRPYQAVCGGCTIGLRSLSIAICLGYSNTHFFGFDSCMGEEDTHHAYKWADEEYESKLLPKIHNIQLGSKEGLIENGKSYRVSGYQLAQLQHFKDFYLNFSNLFTPIFHGEGALPDFYSFIKRLQTNGASK